MLYIPMSDHPSNNSTHKAYESHHYCRYRHHCIQNPGCSIENSTTNDRESDSNKITHRHIDAIYTYVRSSKQQFDSQSLRVAPSLLPSHHCHQNKGWNLENNTTTQLWGRFELNNTCAHWCYTYLWAIIQATIRLTKPMHHTIAVAIPSLPPK